MSVISGIFHEMAKHIPDKNEADQLLQTGIQKDDSYNESLARKAQAAALPGDIQKAKLLLKGLNDDVQKMSYVLLRSGADMAISTVFHEDGIPTLDISVMSDDKALLSFEAKPHHDGRYYLDVEQNYAAFYTSRVFPVDNFEQVEEHLISNLNHVFNVPPEECQVALQRLVMHL